MNKFLKCWVFILCILFILLILFTDRVNAETYNGTNLSFVNTPSISETWEKGAKTFVYDLTQTYTFNDYNYIKGNVYIFNEMYTVTNNITLNYINYNLTCDTQSSIWASYGTGGMYTITYADGSTASISGTQYDYVCTSYSLYGQTQTGTIAISNGTGVYTIEMDLIKDGSINSRCDIDNNGSFTCPVNNSISFNKIRLVVYKSAPSYKFTINLNSTIYLFKSDTQQIINNNNQNTQSIIQQQQNINSSITSDNITGNNSTTTINNLGGTFQTQQDFLLNLIKLPYTFFSALSNTIQNQCSPLTIGTIFDYNLVMPCVNLNNLLGDVWTLIIDVIFAGVIASSFVRRVTKYIREVCTLDTNALNTGGVKIW